MRRVMVSDLKQQPDKKWKLEEKGEALFHCFGMDYEEFEAGPGNYTTAIIEWPDGTTGNIPVERVRFLASSKTVEAVEAVILLRSLAVALDTAYISSWQTTASWQKELDAALEFLRGGA